MNDPRRRLRREKPFAFGHKDGELWLLIHCLSSLHIRYHFDLKEVERAQIKKKKKTENKRKRLSPSRETHIGGYKPKLNWNSTVWWSIGWKEREETTDRLLFYGCERWKTWIVQFIHSNLPTYSVSFCRECVNNIITEWENRAHPYLIYYVFEEVVIATPPDPPANAVFMHLHLMCLARRWEKKINSLLLPMWKG